MGLPDSLIHLLSFLAPALAVAAAVVLVRRLLAPGAGRAMSWWAQVAVNVTLGALALAAGLWYWGADGKMSTYALLVLAVASGQWVCERSWRR